MARDDAWQRVIPAAGLIIFGMMLGVWGPSRPPPSLLQQQPQRPNEPARAPPPTPVQWPQGAKGDISDEKWGVVQVWDLRQLSYPSLILSTNRALRALGTLHTGSEDGTPPVDHVVVISMTDYRAMSFGSDDCSVEKGFPKGKPVDHDRVIKAAALMMALGVQLYVLSDVSTFEAAAAAGGVPKFHDLGRGYGRILEFGRFHAKIFMWNLTTYDRLLWMDADILPVKDFLPLFVEFASRPVAAGCDAPVMMAADVAAGYCYNSGVTMLKPNQKMFRELMSQLGSEATAKMNPAGRPPPNRSACSKNHGAMDNDQDFLQAIFQTKQCFQPISPMHNVMVVTGKGCLDSKDGSVQWTGHPANAGHLNWLFGSARQRNLLYATHFGWPKPEMIHWREDNGFFNKAAMMGELSETKLAYVSLFKTVWMQYSQAIEDACAAIRNLPKGAMFGMTSVMMDSSSCIGEHIVPAIAMIKDGKMREWCDNPPAWGRFLAEDDALQVHNYREDERVKVWQDLL